MCKNALIFVLLIVKKAAQWTASVHSTHFLAYPFVAGGGGGGGVTRYLNWIFTPTTLRRRRTAEDGRRPRYLKCGTNYEREGGG